MIPPRPRPAALLLLLSLACWLLPPRPCGAQAPAEPPPAPSREAMATVVVYNDAEPTSVDLAAYYAKRRRIPLDHLVPLQCSLAEEITRADYDRTIAIPLRKLFADRGWWREPSDPAQPIQENTIRYVVLIRGIPLKIANAPGYPGDRFLSGQPQLNTNAAAVDSELATLGLRTPIISSSVNNPYYRSFRPFVEEPLAPFMLVCRLDAPTPAMVRSMIDGALSAEAHGLNGFAYIDLRGIKSGPYALGDQWLATAAVGLREFGMPLIWDSSQEQFPVDFPMDHAAYYLGWYSADVAGPISRDDFRFVPGAIAVHIHSFSASSLRDAHRQWVAPLIAHGAAATIGNVYEPYLALTPNLDIFTDRLRNGFNFADAAYASERVLSWMTTFIGDPLYRPFALPDGLDDRTGKPASEYAAYRAGAHVWFEKGRKEGEAKLEASARAMESGIIWEGLGLLQWSVPDNVAALASFAEAQKCYGKTEDGLRTVLHQIQIDSTMRRQAAAFSLASKARKTYGNLHGAAMLQSVLQGPFATGR